MVGPGDRKNVAAYLQEAYEVSITRACQTVGLPKSVYYYESKKDDTQVIEKLQELVEKSLHEAIRIILIAFVMKDWLGIINGSNECIIN